MRNMTNKNIIKVPQRPESFDAKGNRSFKSEPKWGGWREGGAGREWMEGGGGRRFAARLSLGALRDSSGEACLFRS